MDYNRDRKCDVCGKGFTKKSWEDHHDFHDKDCHNFIRYDDVTDEEIDNIEHIDCDCELVAHDKCCPQCHPKAAQRIQENQVLREYREEMLKRE